MIGRNDLCWCGSGQKWKKCHYPVTGPKDAFVASYHFDELKDLYYKRYHILLKTEPQIAGIRAAGKLAAQILDATCKMAQAGVTTLELNDYAHKLHLEADAIPAPLHYGSPPFPKSICTSLNEVICHGIPDKRPLQEGDIVNIDVTAIYKGYYGDCSRMVMIGNPNEEKRRVVQTAYDCLMDSVAILKPGIPISYIGDAIQARADANGCSVVNQFVGHGVGVGFHEEPQIPHYRNSLDIILVPGMTFTIEPMINAGVKEAVIDKTDKWTARTKDGKASAQWEHTVLITEKGHEILTPWIY
jgi:methionyl aminopeptidase